MRMRSKKEGFWEGFAETGSNHTNRAVDIVDIYIEGGEARRLWKT